MRENSVFFSARIAYDLPSNKFFSYLFRITINYSVCCIVAKMDFDSLNNVYLIKSSALCASESIRNANRHQFNTFRIFFFPTAVALENFVICTHIHITHLHVQHSHRSQNCVCFFLSFI